jgi:hypothetical protein
MIFINPYLNASAPEPLIPTGTNLISCPVDLSCFDGSAISINNLAPDGSNTAVLNNSATRRLNINGLGTSVYSYSVWLRKPSDGTNFIRITTNNAAAWNTGVSNKIALTETWTKHTFTGQLLTNGIIVRLHFSSQRIEGTLDPDVNGQYEIWGLWLGVL